MLIEQILQLCGTSSITLIIDGLIENDRTTVQYTAFGLVNGSLQFYNCSIHTLFIQGIK